MNTPNNPSGVVYSRQTLEKLASVLTAKSQEYGHPIYLISDELSGAAVHRDRGDLPRPVL